MNLLLNSAKFIFLLYLEIFHCKLYMKDLTTLEYIRMNKKKKFKKKN